jgi:hypothetical protein
MDLARWEEERETLMKGISRIREMRRGSVTEQFLPVKLKGLKNPVLRGPYYVHTTKISGRTVSKRLNLTELEKYRKEIDNFHCFQELVKKLIVANEKIADFKPADNQPINESKKKLPRRFKQRLRGKLTG